MEQLLIKSGNSIFKFIQLRDPDRCDIVLWGWVAFKTHITHNQEKEHRKRQQKLYDKPIKIHLGTAIEIS